ncbi:MAG TPA: hypothetical protein VGV40_00475 [Solirubrobacteraceae bacterium]|nr:hypothetical protein [Solirubrobacteraceae bacterium]
MASSWDDDDDWVGTPPEGRHTRDRARPDFWWHQRWVNPAAAAVGLALIVLVIVVLVG